MPFAVNGALQDLSINFVVMNLAHERHFGNAGAAVGEAVKFSRRLAAAKTGRGRATPNRLELFVAFDGIGDVGAQNRRNGESLRLIPQREHAGKSALVGPIPPGAMVTFGDAIAGVGRAQFAVGVYLGEQSQVALQRPLQLANERRHIAIVVAQLILELFAARLHARFDRVEHRARESERILLVQARITHQRAMKPRRQTKPGIGVAPRDVAVDLQQSFGQNFAQLADKLGIEPLIAHFDDARAPKIPRRFVAQIIAPQPKRALPRSAHRLVKRRVGRQAFDQRIGARFERDDARVFQNRQVMKRAAPIFAPGFALILRAP